MSVPPPSWMPNSTSTGSPSSSVRSTTRRVEGDHPGLQRRQRGERRAEHAGVDDATRPCSRSGRGRGSARRRASGARGRGRPAAPGSPSGARAGSGAGWRGSCGPSRSRGGAAASSACCGPARRARPRACGPRAAARCPRTTSRTTLRATCRLASGSASRRLISVAARCTSGVTFSSTSGSSSSRCRPSRSIASCCTTRTTPLGKCARSSPSQRATTGADLPSPPSPLAVDRVQRAVHRPVLAVRAPRPSPRPPRRRARAAIAAAARRSGLPSSLATVSSAGSRRAPRRSRLNIKGTVPFRFAEAFAEAAALGRGEDGEGAAQQREDVGEGVRRDGRDPAVEDARAARGRGRARGRWCR